MIGRFASVEGAPSIAASMEDVSVSVRINSKLKSQFRETARKIIARDRHARKYGISQNTIGEITSAMIQAYLAGQENWDPNDSDNSTPAIGAIEWIAIPPRSRDTLSRMSFGLSQRFGKNPGSLSQIERVSDDPRPRWRIIKNGVPWSDRTIADGGVAPLIRMKLIEAMDEGQKQFKLTELGVQTCIEYWRRSDADDPTLPVISLR